MTSKEQILQPRENKKAARTPSERGGRVTPPPAGSAKQLCRDQINNAALPRQIGPPAAARVFNTDKLSLLNERVIFFRNQREVEHDCLSPALQSQLSLLAESVLLLLAMPRIQMCIFNTSIGFN